MKPLLHIIKSIFANFSAALKGSEENFTQGSIRRAIFLLSVPMILEMGMESVFAIVDIYFVSKIDTQAIATVGLTETVMSIIYSVALGLSMATTAIVARRVGEKNFSRAADAAFQSIVAGVVAALAIGIPGYLYAADILELMGATPELATAGAGYTEIMFAGNISILLLFLNNAIFRGAGNASIAMRVLILSNSLNIFLDPMLIFGIGPFPEMGVEGAALATTIGRSVGVLAQFYLLFRGRYIVRIKTENIKLQLKVFTELFKVGGNGVLQFLVESLSWMFLIRIVADFGEAAVAGYTVSFRIIVFTILPSWGMSIAAATLVGQNLGAEQPGRAEQSVWKSAKYNTIFLGLVSVIFFLLAEQVVGLIAESPEVQAYGADALKIICTGYVFFAYGMVITQAFNGAGDTATPMKLNLLCFWLIQIPLAYLLAYRPDFTNGFSLGEPFMGVNGVLWAIAISHAIHAVISIYLFRQGKWKSIKV